MKFILASLLGFLLTSPAHGVIVSGGSATNTDSVARAQIATLSLSTAAQQTQINALSVSTATNRSLINTLSLSTASNKNLIDTLSLSTASNKTIIDALSVSTAANAASIVSLANNVGVSTAANYSEIQSTYAAHVAFAATLSGVTGTAFSALEGEVGGKVSKAGDTMTGQLSLSGSTLTVTGQDASGYSVRTSSGIKMTSGCLLFGDGTQQCTKPGVGGDVTQAGANTFTNLNTFSSNVVTNSSFTTNATMYVNGGFVYDTGLSSVSLSGTNITYTSRDCKCVTGSTLTVRTNGGWVKVEFNANYATGTGDLGVFFNYCQDQSLGTYYGYASGRDAVRNQGHVANNYYNVSFSMTEHPAAGTHYYCLNAWSSSGTISLDQATFQAYEVH